MPCRGISNWHYVYVLRSQGDKNFYVGYTRDLKNRLRQHSAKTNFSTRSRLPLDLIYVEACLNEDDVKRKEDYLKTSQGHRFLRLRLRKFLNNN